MTTSCSTLVERNQIISIDSEPRGLPVYLDRSEGAPSGITPFWYEAPKSRNLYLFLSKGDSQRIRYETHCPYDWELSGIGNTAMLFPSPIIGLGGFAVDFYTGAAFNCGKARIKIDATEYPTDLAKFCRKYLLVPPHHADLKMSEALASEWMDQTRLSSCDEIIDYKIGVSHFDYLSIDNHSHVDIKNLSERQVRYLGRNSRASHLVTLSVEEADDFYEVKANVYDMHSGVIVPSEWRTIKIMKREVEKEHWLDSKWMHYVSFIPNSIQYKIAQPSSLSLNDRVSSDEIAIVKDTKSKNLLRQAMGLGMRFIHHPAGLNYWQILFSAYPNAKITFDHSNLRMRVLKEGEAGALGDEFDYSYSTTVVSGFYNIGLNIYTPIGIWGTYLGLGPLWYKYSDNEGVDISRFGMGTQFGFDYNLFLTSNTYVTLGFNTIFPTDEAVVTPHFSRGQWLESYVGIGYFFPQIRRFVRDKI